MVMSAWGFIIAPLMATAQTGEPPAPEQFTELASAAGELEIFDAIPSLDDVAMSAASGGTHTAIDISSLGVNSAENSGQVSDVNVNNTTNGQISNNMVSDNGGITTVFNNTGNGVVMQSIVNLNIFLQGATPQ